MKKASKLIICIIILTGLIISAFATWRIILSPLSPKQFLRLVISGEDVGRNEMSIAKNAAKREPTSTVIIVNGVEHEFILPNGATPYGELYMICSDEFQQYLNRLPSLGYSFVEQMGSSYFYKNEILGINLCFGVSQFSHAFRTFNYTMGGQQ